MFSVRYMLRLKKQIRVVYEVKAEAGEIFEHGTSSAVNIESILKLLLTTKTSHSVC